MLKNLTIHLRHLWMVLQKLKQRFQRNILRSNKGQQMKAHRLLTLLSLMSWVRYQVDWGQWLHKYQTGNTYKWFLQINYFLTVYHRRRFLVKNPSLGKTVTTLTRGWGVTFTKIMHGCACRTSKIWLSQYQFSTKLSTHQYTIFDKKAPNFVQIGCFLQ